MPENRYAVTIDLYVYSNSEDEVKEIARKIAADVDKEHDNKASVVSIHKAEFGKIGKQERVK